jgi:hypothetical protein
VEGSSRAELSRNRKPNVNRSGAVMSHADHRCQRAVSTFARIHTAANSWK